MDIGYMEETYEYYRAKMIKKNEWSKVDEKEYKKEENKKIPFRRIDPMLKINSYDRWLMDSGDDEETYEYYRAKQIKKNEELLNKEDWTRMKEEEKNQPKMTI
jgi:hypothetical protein